MKQGISMNNNIWLSESMQNIANAEKSINAIAHIVDEFKINNSIRFTKDEEKYKYMCNCHRDILVEFLMKIFRNVEQLEEHATFFYSFRENIDQFLCDITNILVTYKKETDNSIKEIAEQLTNIYPDK